MYYPDLLTVYLASPTNQMYANALAGMPVLISFGEGRQPWLDRGYQQRFSRLLIDSGAYGEMNSGTKVDIHAYKEWAEPWREHAEAIAGLDNIKGNWRKSLRNYERIPWSFPTFHSTDPPELLKDLVAMSVERNTWLGISTSGEKQKSGGCVWFVIRCLKGCIFMAGHCGSSHTFAALTVLTAPVGLERQWLCELTRKPPTLIWASALRLWLSATSGLSAPSNVPQPR